MVDRLLPPAHDFINRGRCDARRLPGAVPSVKITNAMDSTFGGTNTPGGLGHARP